MLRNLLTRLRTTAVISLVVLIFLALMFINSFFVIVQAGEVGIVSTFGDVASEPFYPGFHLKNPFAQIIPLNVRTTSYTMSETYAEGEVQGDDSIQALAKDGGLVWFDVTVLYRLKPEAAPEIYKTLGVNYQENIIRPEIRSTIREVAATFPVNDLYSTKRQEVQSTILEELKSSIEARGIVVEDVLLRKVSVSQTLSDTIEQKLAAEQQVEKEEFEIQRAAKQAKKKVIEAKGQRDAQRIINQSLTQKYLNFLYINNLESREGTIYVPLDPKNGLPIFKNVE